MYAKPKNELQEMDTTLKDTLHQIAGKRFLSYEQRLIEGKNKIIGAIHKYYLHNSYKNKNFFDKFIDYIIGTKNKFNIYLSLNEITEILYDNDIGADIEESKHIAKLFFDFFDGRHTISRGLNVKIDILYNDEI
ncbi:MAG: hypothetical protein ACOCP8_03955 [archaeon]